MANEEEEEEEEAQAMETAPPLIHLHDDDFQKYVFILRAMGTPSNVQCEVQNNKLKRLNKEIYYIEAEGQCCFFRAFALLFFYDEELHPFVRAATILFMRRNPHLYAVDFAKMFRLLGLSKSILTQSPSLLSPLKRSLCKGRVMLFRCQLFVCPPSRPGLCASSIQKIYNFTENWK